MATRLYFNTGNSGAINIGAQVGTLWEQNISGAFTTRELGTSPDGTSNTDHQTSSLGNGTNPCDICFGQFISATLPSGVLINGTISGNITCKEGNTSDNLFTQLGLFVVDSGGSLVATLLGGANTGGTEIDNVSGKNRNLPRAGSTSLTSYTTVNATSRIVAEIGVRTESTRTTCVGSMWFGSGVTSDLATGNSTDNSTTKRPWIEFSADIFTPPAGGGARVQAAGFYGFHDQEDPELAGWKRRRSGIWAPWRD